MCYRKSYLLFLTGFIFLLAFVFIKGINCVDLLSTEVGTYQMSELLEETSVKKVTILNKEIAGSKREREVSSCIRELWVYELSDKDYEVLLKIVEAEAGGEDETGKLLVANVVLNRMENDAFPDTVEEVVFQNDGSCYQFSPIGDGRYDKVIVSDETYKAVERALKGEDLSKGALYFVSEKYYATSIKEKQTYTKQHSSYYICNPMNPCPKTSQYHTNHKSNGYYFNYQLDSSTFYSSPDLFH